jgi:aminoglycoside phosphotransferase (APT) family kinase protein
LIAGTPLAALLGDEAGARLAGRLCGEVGARLAGIDPRVVRPSVTWSSADRLTTVARRWVDRCDGLLSQASTHAIRGLLDHALAIDAGAARFAHGDLAPVNVLASDGRITAVLDLDLARVAPPLYDAAWFAWVVGHHHPDVAEAAWRGYALAARLAPERPAAFAWLQPLQLLERAATARDGPGRRRWTARLEALLGGSGWSGDAARRLTGR